ncbi:MAG: tyrosine-type recombinase/integrase [Bacteriovoracia bacterium]
MKATKSAPNPLTYAYVMKSFVGYLQGTEKALHTVNSYRSDLLSFQRYLEHRFRGRPIVLEKVGQKDLEAYNAFLKVQGLKVNTRRRKVLTVRRLFRYLNRRGKLEVDPALKVPAPGKLEKVPFTVAVMPLADQVARLPVATELDERNRLVLTLLLETGCLVSELGQLTTEQGVGSAPNRLSFGGKSPREVPLSPRAHADLQAFARKRGLVGKWLFSGHTRHGPLSGPMSPRGVELLVKAMARRLGFAKLTPRIIRHSVVCHWQQQGVDLDEIQRRLGLKTRYAFRTYEVLFAANAALKPSSKTT